MAQEYPYKLPERKTRLIENISKRYLSAEDVRLKLYNKRWKKWAEEGSKLKFFWGYNREVDVRTSRTKVVYEFDGLGYTHHFIGNSDTRDLKFIAQVADPKDLPLMLNDPKYEESRDYIVAVLKGALPSIVKRQDLVNEHAKLELRYKHIYAVRGVYLRLLTEFIRDRFYEQMCSSSKYGRNLFLIMNIGGHIYHFNCGFDKIELIDNIEYYTVQPEEAIVTPYPHRLNRY